jgi:hypothetical protein
MPVTGDDLAHAGYGRQPLQPDPVVAERVRRDGVEQRNLHVRAHVAGDQDPGARKENGAVAGGVPVMHDQPGLRPVPRDGGFIQWPQPTDQRQVMTGRGPLDLVQDAVPFGRGDGHGGGRGGIDEQATARASRTDHDGLGGQRK